MPVHVCPRCQRSNPAGAAFCYFDGALLQGGNGTPANAQLAREFVFPSGRRCKTFEEFSLGCQEEWVAARELLQKGTFQQFFGVVGRADLVRAAQEAMTQADGDIGLNAFLGVLPVTHTYQPQLDVNPRRIPLGNLLIGDARRVQLTIANQGKGHLQGTLKIAQGGEWLSFAGQGAACPISTTREQKVVLEIHTQKLIALQSYDGKLQAVTNGGVVQIPIGLGVTSKPFTKPPMQGAKTPREMAVLMRKQPKQAVSLLESGEVVRWFASNNWNYPVEGQPAKGLAGVQQFFEAMGLAKPPPLKVSQSEFHFRCESPEPVRFQVLLSTPARRLVYGFVTSDQPWLKVLTPHVNGPQRANISFEVDGRALPKVRLVEATLTIVANAGQKLPVRVVVESPKAPVEQAIRAGSPIRAGSVSDGQVIRAGSVSDGPRPGPSLTLPARTVSRHTLLGGVLAMALLFLVLRLGLAPLVDFRLRGADVRAAAAKLNIKVADDSAVAKTGGWLTLPWTRVLSGTGNVPVEPFGGSEAQGDLKMDEFRHYFVKYFTRAFVFWLWWLGPVAAVVVVWRRGGRWTDLPSAILAGSAAGVVGSATLACAYLMVESVLHLVWDPLFKGKGDLVVLVLWVLVALVLWTVVGALVGLLCHLDSRLRHATVDPAQDMLAGVWRRLGLGGR